MILYDQDFNFIGMSAETLTFLGYEDIDEFTSMHNDFADLFVKQEGFIHKFENFSWIHYVLYSGAANKKAYVMKKDGSQVCVDISIREVFLNHTYDGLRMLYSVKLINEGFTHISKTDVHDNRSPQSNEFSLRNLTQDSSIPDTSAISMTSKLEQEVEESSQTITPPEPLDIKLDIPESDIFKTEEKEETVKNEELVQTPPPLDMNDFKLDLPPIDTSDTPYEKEENSDEEVEEKPLFQLNLDTPSMQVEENTEEKEESTMPLFKLDDEKEKKDEVQLDIDVSKEVPVESEDNIFNFNLLSDTQESEQVENKTVQNIQEESEAPIVNLLKEENEEKDSEPIFNFNLLSQGSQDEEQTQVTTQSDIQQEESALSLQEKLAIPSQPQEPTQAALNINLFDTEETKEEVSTKIETKTATETKEETPKQTPFSFNMFEDDQKTDENSIETITDETKNKLIDQIKSDINEIDQDVQADIHEQKTATEKLKALMQQEPEIEIAQETVKAEATPDVEKEYEQEEKPLFSFDFYKDDTTNITQETTQIQINTENVDTIPYREESSFEETLKNIFSSDQKKSEQKEKNLNIFDTEKTSEKNKQHITKEDIESPDRNQVTDSEKLELPALGNLGLSKEEELDFIEEFLDETAATIALMQEYLELEDYDNIKYNLIKISSSAEILHFEQMLNYTRELAQLCQSEARDAVERKLNELSHLTRKYKEHFSTTTV